MRFYWHINRKNTGEKMKRDGSGMEQKKYILLDVGGTEIKGNVSDRNGVRTKIRKFPAQAQKSTEKILDNFAKICRELMREADGSVVGVGMAIPGPFDYENGISRMQGLNKYDAIYGIPLEREIKARVPELGSARFLFLHDIEAFALGESWYGNCRDADKILCVCIGTGAGSAFVENRKRCAGKWMDLSTAVWRFHFGRLSFCARAGADQPGCDRKSVEWKRIVWSGKSGKHGGRRSLEKIWSRCGGWPSSCAGEISAGSAAFGRTDCKKFFLVWKRTGKRVREKKDSDSDRNGNIRPCHGRPVVTVS
jgi:glucokinase